MCLSLITASSGRRQEWRRREGERTNMWRSLGPWPATRLARSRGNGAARLEVGCSWPTDMLRGPGGTFHGESASRTRLGVSSRHRSVVLVGACPRPARRVSPSSCKLGFNCAGPGRRQRSGVSGALVPLVVAAPPFSAPASRASHRRSTKGRGHGWPRAPSLYASRSRSKLHRHRHALPAVLALDSAPATRQQSRPGQPHLQRGVPPLHCPSVQLREAIHCPRTGTWFRFGRWNLGDV